MLIFTGTLHPGMFRMVAMYERYNARTRGLSRRLLDDLSTVRLRRRLCRRRRLSTHPLEPAVGTPVGTALDGTPTGGKVTATLAS